MIAIEKIETYADEIIEHIADINHKMIVIDDSQLVKQLSDITSDKNLILTGFIPSHKIDGENVDQAKPRDFMVWLVLNKVDRTEGHDAFIDSMKKCQNATRELVKKMLADKPMTDNTCGLMRMLQVPTISIDPVWSLGGCDGYEITYELKTPLY